MWMNQLKRWNFQMSATFGAGVVAPQRPITRHKRQLQPERYAKCAPKIL
jgi:hypothetical protein